MKMRASEPSLGKRFAGQVFCLFTVGALKEGLFLLKPRCPVRLVRKKQLAFPCPLRIDPSLLEQRPDMVDRGKLGCAELACFLQPEAPYELLSIQFRRTDAAKAAVPARCPPARHAGLEDRYIHALRFGKPQGSIQACIASPDDRDLGLLRAVETVRNKRQRLGGRLPVTRHGCREVVGALMIEAHRRLGYCHALSLPASMAARHASAYISLQERENTMTGFRMYPPYYLILTIAAMVLIGIYLPLATLIS